MEHVIEYNSAPAADKFREIDTAELGEIIRTLYASESSAWAAGFDEYDNWQVDIGAATRAAELQDAFGERIFVALDEDGFYFAHEPRPQIVTHEFAAWLAGTSFAGHVEPDDKWDTESAWPTPETMTAARECFTEFAVGNLGAAEAAMHKAQAPFV